MQISSIKKVRLKKVIYVFLGLVLVGVGFGIGYSVNKTVKVPVTMVKTQVVTKEIQPPAYHVGDTQAGVTLVGVYHGDELHQMSAVPYTNYDVFFALKGVRQDDAMNSSAILTTSDQYFGPNSTQQVTSQCGDNGCAGFVVGASNSNVTFTPKEFLYKGLVWQL